MSEAERRLYTAKQMGDACEMLVAAELTLAGVPALKVPDNWPHYDVLAQPLGTRVQRISVKSRTYKAGAAYVNYKESDEFDWLAIVILGCAQPKTRRIFIIPREKADKLANRGKKEAGYCEFQIDKVESKFERFQDNFELDAQ